MMSAVEKKPAIRVLVVEDDRVSRKIARMMLSDLGCDVEVADCGTEALAKSPYEYDIIFMDVGLGDMSGLDVARQIRESLAGKQVSIVALTAHAANDPVAADAEAIDHFMCKPATYKDFEKVLDKYS